MDGACGLELLLLELRPGTELNSDRAVLSVSEHERAAALRTDELRAEFVASRAFLRRLLGRRLGVAPEDVPLGEGPAGKPELAAPRRDRLRFSTSRSGGLALFAVTVGREVGVDIEVLRADGDELAIERRFLAPAEQARLASPAGAERLRAVTRYWARKEAFLKAAGVGLWAPWRCIDTSGSTVRLTDDALQLAGGSWSLLDLDVPASHVAAVCLSGQLASAFRPEVRGAEEGTLDP